MSLKCFLLRALVGVFLMTLFTPQNIKAAGFNSPTPDSADFQFEDFDELLLPESRLSPDEKLTDGFCVDAQSNGCESMKQCCTRGRHGVCAIIVSHIDCEDEGDRETAATPPVKLQNKKSKPRS